jgi:23S rRNA pseudouridine2605 synthase
MKNDAVRLPAGMLMKPLLLAACAHGRYSLRCRTAAAALCSLTSEGNQLVRLDKLLADRGAGSRKDVDRLIRKGLVELDGAPIAKTEGKRKVPWSSVPLVGGVEFPPPPLLAAYHKPLGVVSSMRDERSRPDLASVLPTGWQKALHPVGRLDAETTGLLLFSRDGDLTHKLLHPKYEIEREYVAVVENPIDEAGLRAKLAAGIETIEAGVSLVVQARLLRVERQTLTLTVTEGKYHMVRRILHNAGHPVLELHRTRYGEITLGELSAGEAVPVAGSPLDWALAVKASSVPRSPAPQRDGAGAVPRRTSPRVMVPEGAEQRAATSARGDRGGDRLVGARRDVALIVEEIGCDEAEAAEALRRHDGDFIAALRDLDGA